MDNKNYVKGNISYKDLLYNKLKTLFNRKPELRFPKDLKPISKEWGFDRGLPIDRYYIEKFLRKNSSHIKGNVLEIKNNKYTKKFGKDKVVKSDILDIDESNSKATIIADLARADNIADNQFDCIVLTQTLQLVYDFRSALCNIYRILKNGGVVIATFPGITKIEHFNNGVEWHWSFTGASAKRLFEEFFPVQNIEIKIFGNVLTSSAFLYGLSSEELDAEALKYNDPEYELLICIRAIK